MNVRMDAPFKKRASALYCAALSLLALAACGSEKPKPSDSSDPGGCEDAVCAQNAPAIDWSAEAPTYNAHVRVVNAAGDPVKDAVVSVGKSSATTDKDGRARVGPLPAVSVATIEVKKEGSTPQITKASPWSSSRETQTVSVAPLGVDKMVDTTKRQTLDTNGAQLDVPPRALATPDGARVTAARAQLTFLSGDESAAALPGDGGAIDEAGVPTGIAKLGGVLYVHFENDKKQKLNLAPGQTAQLEMPVSSTMKAKDGDFIPMWSLDETLGQWRKESKCQVATRTLGDSAEQVCVGVVDHFSYWAYGTEQDIYEPGSMGCLNVTAAAEKDACFKVSVRSLSTYKCDAMGANCIGTDFVHERYLKTASDVAWCGVMDADGSTTYRVGTIYDTDTSGCEGIEELPKGGRRSKISEPLSLEAFTEVLGSELMLNFTLNGDRDCGTTLCAQVPITITLKDLEAAPWTDADNDGAFASTDANLKPPFALDCNDERPDIYPYAPEPFCVLEDRNCDKHTNAAYKVHTDVYAEVWNWQCHACTLIPDVNLPLSEEVARNRYDEDCDGIVNDNDGDGQNYPEDCNDYEKTAFKGATEKVGNYIDEDCDGAALDADADGLYNPHHVHLAEKLKAALTQFSDCDDYDASVNPARPVSAEGGALKRYFYTAGGVVRRSPFFCSMFEQNGNPSWLYYNYARDLNCDYKVTDVDGDGFAAPGDPALGVGMDIDCDDTDPRNKPVSKDLPECVVRNDLVNDSVCNVQSRSVGEGCPILTLAGTDVVTVCEEGKNPDGSGTGIGVCSFPGWWDGNPLVVNPDTAWGPCDGNDPDNNVIACPTGTACGGPLPYTKEFVGYLEETYLEGAEQAFLGMCFPGCTLE